MQRNSQGGKLVYTHGPHRGTLAICDAVGIKDKAQAKLTASIIPRYVGKADHYLTEGIVPLIKGYGFASNAPIIVKGNCHYAFYARSSAIRKIALRLKVGDLSDVNILAVSDMNCRDYLGLGFEKVKTCEGFMYRNIEELLRIKSNKEHFIFIGENGYLKGLDRSINTFIKLKEQKVIDKHIKFYIVGNHTEYRKSLVFQESDYDLYNIEFTGSVVNIAELLSQCRYQLHLARYEPNAVAIMEGMAAGLTPLVSDETGNASHIIESGFDPVVFSSADNEVNMDAIVNILSSNAVDTLKTFSLRYSLENGKKRWKDTYEALI